MLSVNRQCKMWAVGQSDPHKHRSRLDRVLFIQRRPESKPSVVHADPDSTHEAARIRVIKFEKALEVMGDSQGPAVECFRSKLEKAKLASRRRPINVEVDECRKFIARSEMRIIDLDEEWTQEMASLTQVRERLQRLEVEQASDSVAPLLQTIPPPDWQTEMDVLKAKLAAMEEEWDEAVRDTARKRQAVGPRGRSIPAMPTLVPWEFDDWMQDRFGSAGWGRRVLEITLKMAEGAECLLQMTGSHGVMWKDRSARYGL